MTDSRSNTGSFNVYLDPAKGEWLDSYEGVPTPIAAEALAVLPGEKRLTFRWQKALHRTLHALGQLAPGLGLAVCLAVAGTYLSAWMGDWKLIEFFEDGKLELYNLKNDLSETTDLAKKMPAKTKELHAAMLKWRKATNAPVPTGKNPLYDPKAVLKIKTRGRK